MLRCLQNQFIFNLPPICVEKQTEIKYSNYASLVSPAFAQIKLE